MNLVWTFLLLAAATGTVYSQSHLSYSGYEQNIRDQCNSECNSQFPALQFPHNLLNLGSVLSGISPITGLVFQRTEILEFYINYSNNYLYLQLTIYGGCSEYSELNIQVIITVPCGMTVQNGCPHFTFSPSSLTCELSVLGSTVNLLTAQALVVALKTTVKTTLSTVLSNVAQNVNSGFSTFSTIFHAGSAACYYTAISITQKANSYFCKYNYFEDSQQYSDNDDYEVDPPQGNEYATAGIGQYVVSRLLSQLTAGCETKHLLTITQIQSLGLNYGGTESCYLYLTYGQNSHCTISNGGVSIQATIFIMVQAGSTVLARASIEGSADAQVTVKDGKCCFNIIASISASGNFQVNYVPSTCNAICHESVSGSLQPIVHSYFGDFTAALNIRLGGCITIPFFGGHPGYRRECYTKPKCIQCKAYSY